MRRTPQFPSFYIFAFSIQTQEVAGDSERRENSQFQKLSPTTDLFGSERVSFKSNADLPLCGLTRQWAIVKLLKELPKGTIPWRSHWALVVHPTKASTHRCVGTLKATPI